MNKLWGLLAAIAAVLVFAGSALALTPKGTIIKNSATVSYTSVAVGSPTYTANSNEVTTEVLQVGGVAISNPNLPINVVPGQADVPNYFTITNTGNFEDQFAIAPAVLSVASGNATHAPTTLRYYVNTYANASSAAFDGVGTALQLALDASGNAITPFISSTPASGAASTPIAGPGGVIYPNGTTIFVVVNIPSAATNDEILRKTQGAASVVSVFDITKSNTTSVSMDDTIQAGSLGVRKDVRNVTAAEAFTAVGPGSGPSATTGKPGDTLEYRITVTNNGAGTAQNIVVTDALDPNTTYVLTSVTPVAGTAQQSSATTPSPTGGGTLTVNIGTGANATNGGSLAGTSPGPAGSVTFTFRVTIN